MVKEGEENLLQVYLVLVVEEAFPFEGSQLSFENTF